MNIPIKKQKLMKDLSIDNIFYNQKFVEIVKSNCPDYDFKESVDFKEIILNENFCKLPKNFECYFEDFVSSIKNDQRINDKWLINFFLSCYKSKLSSKKMKIEAIQSLKELTKFFCSSKYESWNQFCKILEVLLEDQQHLLEHIIDDIYYFIDNWKNLSDVNENVIFLLDFECILVLLNTSIMKINGWFRHAIICIIFNKIKHVDIFKHVEFYTQIVYNVFEEHDLIWRFSNESEYRKFISTASSKFQSALIELEKDKCFDLIHKIIETLMNLYKKPSPFAFYNFIQLFDINFKSEVIKSINIEKFEDFLKVFKNLPAGTLRKHAYYILFKFISQSMDITEDTLVSYVSLFSSYGGFFFTNEDLINYFLKDFLKNKFEIEKIENAYNKKFSLVDKKLQYKFYLTMIFILEKLEMKYTKLVVPEKFLIPKNEPFSLDIFIKTMHYQTCNPGFDLISEYHRMLELNENYYNEFWSSLPTTFEMLLNNASKHRGSGDFVICVMGILNLLGDIKKDEITKKYYFKNTSNEFKKYQKITSELFYKFYSQFKHVIFTNPRLAVIVCRKLKEFPSLALCIEDLTEFINKQKISDKKKFVDKFILNNNVYSELLDLYLYPYATKNDFTSMRIVSEYSIKNLKKINLLNCNKFNCFDFYYLTPLATRAEMLTFFNKLNENELSKLFDAIKKEIKNFNENYTSFPFSDSHLRISRLLQLLMVTVNKFNLDEQKSLLQDCYDIFYSKVHQSSVRIYGEIVASKIIFQNMDFLNMPIFIKFMREAYQVRPGSVVSFINILHNILKGNFSKFKDKVNCNFINESLKAIAPWVTNNNFAVKNSAVHTLKFIKNVINMYDKFKDDFSNLFLSIIVDGNLINNGNGTKILQNMDEDFYYGSFDIFKNDTTFTYLVIFPENLGFNKEESHRDLVEFWDEIFGNHLLISHQNEDDLLLLNRYSILNGFSYPDYRIKINKLFSSTILEESNDPSQRKIAVPKILPIKENTSVCLYVIASLVNKPENLGGLCRTCESFRIDKLLIDNLSVIKTKNFSALSMNADEWQDIEELKKDNIVEFIKEQKNNGFKVVALEQTTNSVIISDYKFPSKAIIILGDEKEGVPSKILKLCNDIIEIKQYGKTRSLNVHVSGALLMYQYRIQHPIL
uniref:SpoU_methylase domain-containing protein n=1 Tax=Strongyloides stercoralis TaxID=6248 RepID=A0A0K0DYE5_STRER